MRLYQPYLGQQNNQPIPAAPSVQTDAQGQFVMSQAPVGRFKLMADGGTAQRPGAWPTVEFDIVTISGQKNTTGMPIYLLPLDPMNKLCVTASTGGTLTLPQIPGFALTVAPGSAVFPGGARSGCITVTPVHIDKVPMVPGFGQQPKFVVTIQPVGTAFNPPAAITMPNVDGLKPREVTEMYSFDHDLSSFVAIGTGTVSDNGSVVQADPGVGVLKAGWHCYGNPIDTGDAENITLTLTPDIAADVPNQELQFTAKALPTPGITYTWRLANEKPGEDLSAFAWVSQPSCIGAAECTAKLTASRPAQATLIAQATAASGVQSQEKRATPIAITASFQEVWSDQLAPTPDKIANLLPGRAGKTSNANGYMLMGARADGNIYGKATFQITPDTQEARSRLKIRFARDPLIGSGTPIPEGNGGLKENVADFNTGAPLVNPLLSFATKVRVVAGIDTNGNGQLESNEPIVKISPYDFRTVSQSHYTYAAFNALGVKTMFLLLGLPGRLLGAFLSGDPPSGAIDTPGILSLPEPEPNPLEHNVGANFITQTSAPIHLYQFISGSNEGRDIRESITLFLPIKMELWNRASAFFSNSQNPSESTFTFALNNLTLDFSQDGALFLAFGKAVGNLNVTSTVRRDSLNPLALTVSSLSITGALDDLYDWDYEIDPNQAEVQAGFPTLGDHKGGQVFKIHVILDGQISGFTGFPLRGP